ncbi:MAG: thioredoxin family protein [Rhizobacter sp.]|nr:thioredoxin family protein [Chlorobiales bacterium]
MHLRVHCFRWLALMLLMLTAAPVSAQLFQGKPLVTPSLITNASDASKPFTVGVRFKIAPEWHLYWKNAGDAGLPIEVKWQLPEGFTASGIQYPTPHKIVQAGIVAFGYENEVVLLATITPPKDFNASGKVSIKADLNWLVCQESCIPGNGAAELTFGNLSAAQRLENKNLIEKYTSQLPQPLSRLSLKSRVGTKATAERTDVEISLEGDDAVKVSDFFPETFEKFLINHIDIKTSEGKITFPLTPKDKTSELTSLQGLLILGEKGYEFSVPVTAKGDGAPAGNTGGGLIAQDFNVQDEAERLSLAWVLVLAFAGGLLLNVMPCVLPVLSLKVMSFVQQSAKGKDVNQRLSLLFAAGVVASFWALAAVAVLLQSAGSQIGWGFQFQSPIFVLVMTAVIFVFGLNLVGVFEFGTPAVSGEVSATLSRNDNLGAFMNGVLATTLATPCTAPFLGTALGFAFSQPAWVIFAVFTAAALGLAVPYVVLSWNPAWLKFIPKPGLWMVRFKQLMGFLLFATAVWLLTVIGSQLGAEGVVWTVAFLLALSVAAWLIGQYADFTAPRGRKVAVYVIALLIAAGSYYWMFERQLRWREVGVVASTASAIEEGGIPWKPFTLASLEQDVADGKTVFIDFTADWCFTCKVTEKTVLETQTVRNKIKELGIVAVRADWTNRNDEITALLKKFGRSGVPLYVVFPAGKPTEPIILPEVITTGLLIDAFQKASPKNAASVQ